MNRDYTSDKREGNHLCDILFRLFGHASLSISHAGKHVYVDPCLSENDFVGLPKADVILVTHHHDDHFDPAAIEQLSKPTTMVIAPPQVAEQLDGALDLGPGQRLHIMPWGLVETVAAYNIERPQFHPKERGDVGYVVTMADKRIYIGGDTELTPEMLAVEAIDYLFLNVNLPYTMTVDMAVEAARKLSPKVFYPIHTIGMAAEEIATIKERLADTDIEVVLAPME